MLTFADPLHHAERCFPDDEAVLDGSRRYGFGELVDRCRRLAGALEALSEPGDRIALIAQNSHQVLETYLAAPAVGRPVVPLNARLSIPELRYALEDSGARLLLSDRPAEDLAALQGSVVRVIRLGDDYEDRIQGAPRARLGAGVEEEDVAGLFYTGGTTGASKGVMITHRNKLADTLHLQSQVRAEHGDGWLVLGPMYHASGTFQAHLSLYMGVRQLLIPGFDAQLVHALIEDEGATLSFGVPAMLQALADLQAEQPRDVSSLRMMGYGAAPASSALVEHFARQFPGTNLVTLYGATELSPTATALSHVEGLVGSDAVRTAGRPVPGVQIRIVDAAGDELPNGRDGEVVVRGPTVMRGYWNKPEQTAEVLREGWYHTGDVGHFDDQGRLFLVDRKKDMIISGGENVYSTEVEDVLYRHPDVHECAVFGVPDDQWGEAVNAVVVPRAGTSPDEETLRTHCRASLGGYKIPKAIHIRLGPLPRSAAGKVLKRELRAPFWKDQDRQVH